MERRAFLSAVTGGLLAAPLAVEAQQAGKVHKVGLLSPPPGAYVAAFEESLRQLGYVRGSNITLEVTSTGGKPELLPAAVAELLRLYNERRAEEATHYCRHEPPASKRMVKRFASDRVGHRPPYGERSNRRESSRTEPPLVPKSAVGKMPEGRSAASPVRQ